MFKQCWYHWLVLACVVLAAAIVGLLDLATGAASDGPFFEVDNVFVRVLGAALLASSVLMLMRRRLGYVLAAVGFLLSGLELAVTWLLGQPIAGVAVAIVVVVFVAFAGAAVWVERAFVRSAAGA